MKKVYKFFILSLAITGLMFQSCETIELEATDNPNSLTVDQIDPLLLYNSIQLNYLAAVTTFNNNGGQLARIDYLGDEDYFNYAGSSSLNVNSASIFDLESGLKIEMKIGLDNQVT